jgi:hypothetical protein
MAMEICSFAWVVSMDAKRPATRKRWIIKDREYGMMILKGLSRESRRGSSAINTSEA